MHSTDHSMHTWQPPEQKVPLPWISMLSSLNCQKPRRLTGTLRAATARRVHDWMGGGRPGGGKSGGLPNEHFLPGARILTGRAKRAKHAPGPPQQLTRCARP